MLLTQVRVDWGKKQPKFFTKDDGALKLHPGSVNALQPGALMHKCVRVCVYVCMYVCVEVCGGRGSTEEKRSAVRW